MSIRVFASTIVCGLAIALIGCGDDGGTDDADAAITFDAGPTADADTTDATPPPLDAAVAGLATITVTSGAMAIPGVDVVWYDPTGAVQEHEATNVTGSASEEILPGSALTLAIMAGPTPLTITYIDIQPGDELVWSFGNDNPTHISDLTVTMPGNFGGADNYRVFIGCNETQQNNGTVPITGFEVYDTCLGSDTNIDVIAMAYNGDDPVAYDHVTDLPVVMQGTTIATMDAWQTTGDPLTFTLTNVPADVMGAGIETNPRVDGVSFIGPNSGGGVDMGEIEIITGYWSDVTIDPIQYVSFLGRGTMVDPEGVSILLGSRPGEPSAISHDLANLIPTITDVQAADASGQLEVSWTASDSLAGIDGTLVISTWTDDATNKGAYVMIPPGATSPVVLPALPAALSAFRTSGTAVFGTPTLIALEADFFDGYDDFRVDGWRIFGDTALDLLPDDGVVYGHLGGTLPGGNMNAALDVVPHIDASEVLPRAR